MAIISAIVGAVSAVSAFIGGLGVVGTALLRAAVGIGLNLLASAIAGKPKGPVFSINGTLRSGGDVPRSFILGRTATAGSLVWANTWGQEGDTPNAFLTQVIAISDLPVQYLEQVWVNSELVTLGPQDPLEIRGQPVIEYRKDGVDHLWVKFYDGTQTSADFFLVSTASNAHRQWQDTRIGHGVAYAIVTAKVEKTLFSGIPNFKFVPVGIPLYDPSRDSSVGGSGDHRWNNPATWGGDGDHIPAVQIYNLMRGITYQGKWFYGLQGMTAPRLPPLNWAGQIWKCRAGDTYRSGGEVTIDAPLSAAVEALLTACQGRVSEIGGVYSIFLGEPDAPIAPFHDSQILSTDEQSFTPFYGLADTINGIAATYPSPGDAWAVKAAPSLYRTDLEAEAGNRRLMASVSLDFVPYPEQVQRLMKSALAEGQRARRHTIVLPPEFWPFAYPGAVLAWTSPRNGYIDKHFRIDGAVDRGNLDVMLDITEVDPSDYDWNPATDYNPPIDGAVGVIRPETQVIIGWQVFPATMGPPGKELPSIRVAFPGQLTDVRAVRVQVRLAPGGGVMFDGEVPYGDPNTNDPQESVILSGTFSPNTDYEVRGIFQPFGGRETSWTEWLPVTTPDVWISDIYGDIDLDALADDVAGYMEWVGQGVRDIEQRFEQIDLQLVNLEYGANADRKTIQEGITATYGKAKATWTREINVVAGETVAISQRVETLTSDLESLDGTVAGNAEAVDALQTIVTTQGNDIEATSSALTSLTSSVTDNTSQIGAQGTAISGLQTTTSSQGGQISSLSSQMTSLNSTVTTHTGQISGQSSAISGLQTNVTTIDGKVSAQAQAITQLSAATDPNLTTTANFRMQVVTGPSGYSRIGGQGRVGGSGGWRSAGWYVDVPNSTSQPTRFVVQADQFVVTSSAAAAGVNPLVWQGGILMITGARIGWAQIDNVNIQWAQIANAVVGNFVAQTANIGDLTVNTIKIAGDAVSTSATGVGPNSTFTTAWHTVAAVWLQVPTDAQYVECILLVSAVASTTPYQYIDARLTVGGSVIATAYRHAIVSGPSTQVSLKWMVPSAGAKNFGFDLRMSVDSPGVNVSTIGPIVHARAFRR